MTPTPTPTTLDLDALERTLYAELTGSDRETAFRRIAAIRQAFDAITTQCRELQAENERQQTALAEYATKNTHLMNDVVQMGMARDDYYEQLAAAQERIAFLERRVGNLMDPGEMPKVDADTPWRPQPKEQS